MLQHLPMSVRVASIHASKASYFAPTGLDSLFVPCPSPMDWAKGCPALQASETHRRLIIFRTARKSSCAASNYSGGYLRPSAVRNLFGDHFSGRTQRHRL